MVAAREAQGGRGEEILSLPATAPSDYVRCCDAARPKMTLRGNAEKRGRRQKTRESLPPPLQ